jgi:hypothetical protein
MAGLSLGIILTLEIETKKTSGKMEQSDIGKLVLIKHWETDQSNPMKINR